MSNYSYQRVLDDLVNNIAQKYLSPDIAKNRVSVFGYQTEAMAKSIYESQVLADNRASDDVIELTENTVKLRAAAKVRGIPIANAEPSDSVFVLLLRLDDITTSVKVNGEYQVKIDRKSYFTVNDIPFSLNDDLLIRLKTMETGDFNYSVSFIGGNDENVYLRSTKVTLDDGSKGIAIFITAFQYRYSVSTKMVTDIVEFQYTGIPFDYNDAIADFFVEYRKTSTSEFVPCDLIYHRSDENSATAIYYNDDRDGVIYIMNNPTLGLSENTEIRVTIRETVGSKGNFTVGTHKTLFTQYQDDTYTNINLLSQADILTDAVRGKDAPTISQIRQMMIKNRFGFVGIDPEDITTYLNDFVNDTIAIRKRNDIQARVINNYMIIRDEGGLACPTRTADLKYKAADFDVIHGTTNRKVIKANNIYTLGPDGESMMKTLKSIDIKAFESDVSKLALNIPLMMIINGGNILSYYLNSMDEDINLKYNFSTDFRYQMFSQTINIYRDSLLDVDDDKYTVKITAVPNSPDTMGVVNEAGAIIDTTKLMAYIRILNSSKSAIAYFPLTVTAYDKEKTIFTLEGSFKTDDYITAENMLHITSGMYVPGTNDPFTDVIPFDDLYFDIIYAYKEAPTEISHTAYNNIPNLATYTITNTYANIDAVQLIKNLSMYMQSYVKLTEEDDGQGGKFTQYLIKEVPFIKYSYMKENIALMHKRMQEINDTYVPVTTNLVDHMVNLKFVSTYGKSKNLTVQGSALNNLMPVINFRAYGKNVKYEEIRKYVLSFFHAFGATSATVFVSNLNTEVETKFTLESFEYLGVDSFGPGYQKFVNYIPDVKKMTREQLVAYVPEYLNIQIVNIDIKEE